MTSQNRLTGVDRAGRCAALRPHPRPGTWNLRPGRGPRPDSRRPRRRGRWGRSRRRRQGGQGGAQGGQGQPAPARRGGFTQFTRPLASQDVLVRGQALYETNCASCHNVRPSRWRQGRESPAIGHRVARSEGRARDVRHHDQHAPPFNLSDADSVAIAEYIHSIHATMAGQGSPPGTLSAEHHTERVGRRSQNW